MSITMPHWLIVAGGAGLTALILGGCAEVKQTLDEADTAASQAMGVEGQAAPSAEPPTSPAPSPAERAEAPGTKAYQRGLEHLEADEPALAAERFRQAAEAGHPAAAYRLALLHTRGRGVPRDLDAGARWLNVAADRGHAGAQYLLGAAYTAGDGVERDYETAAQYFAKAAVQGHPRAQYLLAEAFARGRGVRKDLPWAARWYGKAAHQGHTRAQFAYGALLAAGRGLQPDRPAGYMWLKLAADAGHDQAPALLAKLRDQIPVDAVTGAEAAAERFRPGPTKRFADRPTVRYVQQALNALGYDAGPVDGLMGPRTRAGLRAFQRTQGLEADGELTPVLLRRLLDARRAQV